jgi:hypothetical protein
VGQLSPTVRRILVETLNEEAPAADADGVSVEWEDD